MLSCICWLLSWMYYSLSLVWCFVCLPFRFAGCLCQLAFVPVQILLAITQLIYSFVAFMLAHGVCFFVIIGLVLLLGLAVQFGKKVGNFFAKVAVKPRHQKRDHR